MDILLALVPPLLDEVLLDGVISGSLLLSDPLLEPEPSIFSR